jgi:hypothetical protein
MGEKSERGDDPSCGGRGRASAFSPTRSGLVLGVLQSPGECVELGPLAGPCPLPHSAPAALLRLCPGRAAWARSELRVHYPDLRLIHGRGEVVLHHVPHARGTPTPPCRRPAPSPPRTRRCSSPRLQRLRCTSPVQFPPVLRTVTSYACARRTPVAVAIDVQPRLRDLQPVLPDDAHVLVGVEEGGVHVLVPQEDDVVVGRHGAGGAGTASRSTISPAPWR